MIRARATPAGHLFCGVLLSLAVGTAWASSGIVIDPKGDPLEGVRVCYTVVGVEELCVSSDENGNWELPQSRIDTIRLTLDGYLPKKTSGGEHPEPVILEFAATLLVKLEDASGEPVESGQIQVIYSSGKRIGPFPISRASGTRIRSLLPGPIVIVARSLDYAEGRASEELRAGEETVAIVQLKLAEDP